MAGLEGLITIDAEAKACARRANLLPIEALAVVVDATWCEMEVHGSGVCESGNVASEKDR